MKNEIALPEEIIELLGKKKFTSLSAGEQKMVLDVMPEMEYNELHAAQQNVGQYFDTDNGLHPSAKLKQNLDMAFAQKHPKRKSILLQRVELWKVAAVFLLFFSASAFYLKQNSAAKTTAEILVHDTIFADKNIEVIKHIIDTVVEYKYAEANKEKVQKRTKITVDITDENRDTARVWRVRNADIGIRTLQPEDLIKELPNNNGKSMQEDELVRTFGFARI